MPETKETEDKKPTLLKKINVFIHHRIECENNFPNDREFQLLMIKKMLECMASAKTDPEFFIKPTEDYVTQKEIDKHLKNFTRDYDQKSENDEQAKFIYLAQIYTYLDVSKQISSESKHCVSSKLTSKTTKDSLLSKFYYIYQSDLYFFSKPQWNHKNLSWKKVLSHAIYDKTFFCRDNRTKKTLVQMNVLDDQNQLKLKEYPILTSAYNKIRKK